VDGSYERRTRAASSLADSFFYFSLAVLVLDLSFYSQCYLQSYAKVVIGQPCGSWVIGQFAATSEQVMGIGQPSGL